MAVVFAPSPTPTRNQVRNQGPTALQPWGQVYALYSGRNRDYLGGRARSVAIMARRYGGPLRVQMAASRDSKRGYGCPRAPDTLSIATLPRDCSMKTSPLSPSSPFGKEARGAERVRAPSAWSALNGLFSQRSLAKIAQYPAASDHKALSYELFQSKALLCWPCLSR